MLIHLVFSASGLLLWWLKQSQRKSLAIGCSAAGDSCSHKLWFFLREFDPRIFFFSLEILLKRIVCLLQGTFHVSVERWVFPANVTGLFPSGWLCFPCRCSQQNAELIQAKALRFKGHLEQKTDIRTVERVLRN